MPLCLNCGKEVVNEGVYFCPKCERLLKPNLGEEQRYIPKFEAPLKEKNWFERHLNWTIVLGLLGSFFALVITYLIIIMTIDYHVSEDLLYGIGYVILTIVPALVWGWVLKKKNRSLWWLPLGLFVVVGWIVLICLDNHSETCRLSEIRG